MYLGHLHGFKAKNIGILIPKDLDTHQLSDEEMAGLVEQLRNSGVVDKSNLVQKIFNGHIKLGLFIAGQYANKLKHLQFDLANEALLGLYLGIGQAITKLRDNNITPYLSQKVHQRLYQFIRKEMRKLVVDKNQTEESLIRKSYRQFFKDRTKMMMETLDAVCKTQQDETIIKMRLAGYNDVEIAQALGLTKVMVGQIRHRIGRRFRRQL